MPALSRTINKQQLTVNKRKGFTLIELLVARHPKPWRRKSIHGFTLIELLVVIAIIGILASFAIASFTSAQAKGRDSRRKDDLDAIKKALELFKGDTTGSAKYPNTTTGSLVTLGYMRALPTDPSSSATNYNYTAFQANGTSACSGGGDTLALASAGNCETFRLYACLENVNDSQKDAVDGNAADLCTTTGVVSYTVRNP